MNDELAANPDVTVPEQRIMDITYLPPAVVDKLLEATVLEEAP